MSKEQSKKIPSFVQGALNALQSAVRKTIADHRRSGDPIAVWRDGKAVLIPARLLGHKAHHRKAA